MLMRDGVLISTPVKVVPVNWLPGSVLKMSEFAVACESVLKGLDADAASIVIDKAPRTDATAEPIEHNRQIDEAARHRDVGNVHRPHLVGPRDRHPAQQIRVDLVTGFRLRRTRTAIKRLDFHPLHQRLHVTPADLVPLSDQQALQHPRARETELQMQPVETPQLTVRSASGTGRGR